MTAARTVKGMDQRFTLTRTCDQCPWRRDVPPGRFKPERFEALAVSVQQGWHHPMFACHKAPEGREFACVGFLMVDGCNNFMARLAAMDGSLDPAKLSTAGPLYDSFEEMAAANGVKPRRT